MTKDQQEIYDTARMGIINRLAEMKKTINMIESWMFYGEMERLGKGRCAAISEETVGIDNDSCHHKTTGDKP